jgi:serine/threonine protein phosphatase PrpC
LNLSRSLGDLEYKQNKRINPEEQMITANPDVFIETLNDDCDFMIIACDGVWDCKTNQEACDFVSERLKKNLNMKLSKIIEELLDEILAPDIYTGNIKLIILIETGVGCDNMTCVIVQFKKLKNNK